MTIQEMTTFQILKRYSLNYDFMLNGYRDNERIPEAAMDAVVKENDSILEYFENLRNEVSA